MVEAGHAAYTNRFHELARLVSHLVTPESRKIERLRKGENVREPSKDKSGRDDNKMTRTENVFASTANPVGRENTDVWPKCTTCNSYHAPEGPCRTCFNYNRSGQLENDCRGVPRNVNHVNTRNQLLGHVLSVVVLTMLGSWNQENQARGMAFMLGAKEARQDPNIVT
nr:hypothetical protein [Tanacetum cinerariifolium]